MADTKKAETPTPETKKGLVVKDNTEAPAVIRKDYVEKIETPEGRAKVITRMGEKK